MTKPMKKPEYLLPFARLHTSAEGEAYDSIQFRSRDVYGDEASPALASPVSWSDVAVGLMEERAACAAIPAELRAIEENTVPSWLWQRRPRGSALAAEGDLRSVIDRAVGSATAKAWKHGLFRSEKHARTFFDETRFGLMQRQIAIVPAVMASWGLNWAYGMEEAATQESATADLRTTSLSNAAIDALVDLTGPVAQTLWAELFAAPAKEPSRINLRLSDIAADWHSGSANPAQAAIDVLALRHTDGSLNIDALRQAARLLTILLDLQERSDVTIGLANIAPLLLALGLTYNSEAGRAMAASIAALVTAECYATSAELAALRGASDAFGNNRDAIMRSLRNHHRAVYGDTNDYEKLSVLPAPLPLTNCPDLTLAAEAQRRWDEALAAAHAFGLRAVHVTDLTPSSTLRVLMTCATLGLEPMPSLTLLVANEDQTYHQALHPAVGEAISRLTYPRIVVGKLAAHIAGTHSLRRAPAINHATLAACGMTPAALEKIEAYLPCVNTVRLAVTPWIVGVEFCVSALKIDRVILDTPGFDLLTHLGFTAEDIVAADCHCYGAGTARNAKLLQLRHRPLFACGAEVSTDARIRIASAVQSFISGDTGLTAALPAQQGAALGAEVTLSAWRRGLKSLTIVFDPAIAAPPARKTSSVRQIKAATQPHAQPMSTVSRVSRGRKSAPVGTERKSTERRTRGN